METVSLFDPIFRENMCQNRTQQRWVVFTAPYLKDEPRSVCVELNMKETRDWACCGRPLGKCAFPGLLEWCTGIETRDAHHLGNKLCASSLQDVIITESFQPLRGELCAAPPSTSPQIARASPNFNVYTTQGF